MDSNQRVEIHGDLLRKTVLVAANREMEERGFPLLPDPDLIILRQRLKAKHAQSDYLLQDAARSVLQKQDRTQLSPDYEPLLCLEPLRPHLIGIPTSVGKLRDRMIVS